MIAREKGSGQSLTGRFTLLSLTGRGSRCCKSRRRSSLVWRRSSRNLSCSCLDYSLASSRFLIVSISCCNVGASTASGPDVPCLVFLILLRSPNTIVDGIIFYRAHGGCQMFSPVDRLVEWSRLNASFRIYFFWESLSSLLVVLEYGTVVTEDALPVDYTLTIKLVRAHQE